MMINYLYYMLQVKICMSEVIQVNVLKHYPGKKKIHSHYPKLFLIDHQICTLGLVGGPYVL